MAADMGGDEINAREIMKDGLIMLMSRGLYDLRCRAWIRKRMRLNGYVNFILRNAVHLPSSVPAQLYACILHIWHHAVPTDVKRLTTAIRYVSVSSTPYVEERLNKSLRRTQLPWVSTTKHGEINFLAHVVISPPLLPIRLTSGNEIRLMTHLRRK